MLASTERTSSASAPFGRQFRVSLPCVVGRSGVERVLEVGLSPEEERKYVDLWLAGDIEARNVLIEHNLRLVAHIMNKG